MITHQAARGREGFHRAPFATVNVLPTEERPLPEFRIPSIDAVTFAQHAEKAKANCPVKALAGTQITLEATLRVP